MTKQSFETLEEALETLQDIPLPDPDRRARFRADLLDHVDVLRAQQVNRVAPETVPAQTPFGDLMSHLSFQRRLNPMLAVFVAVIVAIAGGLGGMVFASDAAAPGDALYGVDRTVENIRYGLAGPQAHSNLALQFAQERYEEVNTLMDEGDDSDELLVGLDEAIAAVQALLDDPTLSDDARAAIQAQLDYLIELRAQLDPGTLVELEIEQDDGTVQVDVDVEDTPEPEIEDTPEPEETLEPEDTPEPEETPEDDDQGEDDQDEGTGISAEFEIVGTLDSISGQTYIIDGVSYTLGDNAEVKGTLVPGGMVKAHLVTLTDGTTVIREIEPLSSSDDDSSADDNSGSGSSDDNSGSSSDDSSESIDDEHDDNSGSGSHDDDEHDDDHSGSGSHDDDHEDDD